MPDQTGGIATTRDLTITRLSVYEDRQQIVQWGGRILAEHKFWVVDYSVSEPGWIDRDYRPTFTDEESAWRHVEELGSTVCIPVAVVAAAVSGANK